MQDRTLVGTAVALLLVVCTVAGSPLFSSESGYRIRDAASLRTRDEMSAVIKARNRLNELRPAIAKESIRRDDGTEPLTCDACLLVGNAFDDALKYAKDLAQLDKVINFTCRTLIRDAHAADICIDVIEELLNYLHKRDGSITWDLSELFCADILRLCTVDCCLTKDIPEQVHISFTGGDALTATSMQVAWVTATGVTGPSVQWWATANGSSTAQSAQGVSRTYTHGGWKGWIHGAVMVGLQPGTAYSYTVGSLDGGWSQVYSFETLPANAGTDARPLRVVSFADMGVGGTHNATVNQLISMVEANEIDFILHTGDISYADADMYRWDRFMRQMEPIVSRVPYMTSAGNHELPWNFTAYKQRFFMPASGPNAGSDAMYYTFSVGRFRFLHMDSETWWDTPRMDPDQVAWASGVLAEANAQKQFIVVGFHRPVYCSSGGGETCHSDSPWLRSKIESVLYEHQVGIVHTGHVHNYERTYPIYNLTVAAFHYNNTQAPVSFVNGAPGCDEGFSGFERQQPTWSAKRIASTGVMQWFMSSSSADPSHFTVDTHFLSSVNGSRLDSMHLTKRV